MEACFKGIKASPGISFAKAFVFAKHEIVVNMDFINQEEIDGEKEKYIRAVKETYAQTEELMEAAELSMGAEKAAIFGAHLEILTDPIFEEAVFCRIEQDKKNVELALLEATEEIVEMFLSLDDEYLRERGEDVKDIYGKVMRNLKGVENISLQNLTEDVIVVAKDLTPSDTASMDLAKVKGFITDMGGKTGHTVIMAKSLGIPAIVGMGDFSDKAQSGDFIILDGMDGIVFLNPDEKIAAEYKIKKDKLDARNKLLESLKTLPAVTTDDKRVELAANIGKPKDIEAAAGNGAEGIGLFRTEFLYMESDHFPTEEEQFKAYKDVAVGMNNLPVIIRTLDIGGDKGLPYYSFAPEMNPFLGYRAIRLCLDRTDIFKSQLRAILRASAFGKIKIMFPMIISVSELRQAKSLVAECMGELKAEKVEFDEKIELGIMIETPAAVTLAETLAKECDFFSIGTNDLTQYMLAVDRGNENISSLYNSFHPAVLHSIKKAIDASHKEGKWTGVCGEFASDERAVLFLLGLGLDEFSMNAASISHVKDLIRKVSFEEMRKVSAKALEMDTAEEIELYLDNVLKGI